MATVSGFSADETDVLVTDFQHIVMQSLQTVLEKTAANLPSAIIATAAYSANDANMATHYWEEQVDGVEPDAGQLGALGGVVGADLLEHVGARAAVGRRRPARGGRHGR